MLTLKSKRERIAELFREYETYNKKILALDESDSEDVSEIEDAYTSRAYQLERSDESDPTVVEFLQYLEKRALALENAEPASSSKGHKTAVVNVATSSEARPCAISGATGGTPASCSATF
ncbi:hypothetical protein O0L34_g12960 [Tuta absoluta]|nr:hypothetical protein O0L34_g12960 [Tuta absoluta]